MIKKTFQKQLRETGIFLLDVLYNAVIIIVLVVLIRSFLISPFRVVGSSMVDTLQNKEFILIDKLSYLVGDVDRGDPIVFLPPATSKDKAMFEEVVRTDETGVGKLELKSLIGQKETPYCDSKLMAVFWFCKQKPGVNDLVYYAPQNRQIGNTVFETDWKNMERLTIQKADLKKGYMEINGVTNQSYTLRIYNSMGVDYFVKRVIGVPGDTVKIENGRVYLKGPKDEDFKEIEESSFLNKENFQRTYITQSHRQNVYTVPEGHYFVMGDNRNHSNDSRAWLEPITQEPFAFVPEENISGKVMVVLWPINKIRLIHSADF